MNIQAGRTFTVDQRVWRNSLAEPGDPPISGTVIAVLDDEKAGLHYVVRWWISRKQRFELALVTEIAACFPHAMRGTREMPVG